MNLTIHHRPQAQTDPHIRRRPHFCLGMNLAKLELEMVFRELLTPFPNMRLDGSAPPRTSLFLQQT